MEWAQSLGVLSFKVKGTAHSVTNGTQLAPIATETFSSVEDFVEYACTENRMDQGLDYLREIQLEVDGENLDTFLEWLAADIKKEETNTIKNSHLNPRDVSAGITKKGTAWFQRQLTQ